MRAVLTVLAAGFLLAGTFFQGWTNLLELRRREEIFIFRTVDDWREEHGWRHPVHRWRQRRLIRQLLRESPEEAVQYRYLRRAVLGWALLFAGSASALVDALGAGSALGR